MERKNGFCIKRELKEFFNKAISFKSKKTLCFSIKISILHIYRILHIEVF